MPADANGRLAKLRAAAVPYSLVPMSVSHGSSSHSSTSTNTGLTYTNTNNVLQRASKRSNDVQPQQQQQPSSKNVFAERCWIRLNTILSEQLEFADSVWQCQKNNTLHRQSQHLSDISLLKPSHKQSHN